MRFRLAQATRRAACRSAPRRSAILLILLALALSLLGALPAFAQDLTCYAVADEGGGDGTGLDDSAEDLLTRVDPDDPDPASNETSIGDGTGTFRIEASAFQPGTETLFAVDGDRLGTLDLQDASFAARPAAIGTGNGANGSIDFTDVDGLTFDPDTGVLYASQRIRTEDPDVLLVIDPETGSHVPDAFGPGHDYLLVTPLHGEAKIDDLAIATDGTMYAIVNEGGHNDRLVTIDPGSGALTEIGATGENDIEGLTMAPGGRLLGITGKEASQGEALWDIDTDSGVVSNARPLDNGRDYESVACVVQAQVPPPAEVGSITIVKDARPDGATNFHFTGDLGSFALDDDGDAALPGSRTWELDAGRYDVRESARSGWKLTKIACVDPDGGTTASVTSRTATIDLDGGENVVCTYTNARLAVLSNPPIPATGAPGLGALSLTGFAMVAAGVAMRSAADRGGVAWNGRRSRPVDVYAASRVTGLPGAPARRIAGAGTSRARWRNRVSRVLPSERGPPMTRAP